MSVLHKLLSFYLDLTIFKGGQSAIAIDIHRRYPRAYTHRHCLQTPATRPTGFRQEGPSEVYILASKLATMVEGESNEGEAITIQNLIDGKEYEVPMKKIYP